MMPALSDAAEVAVNRAVVPERSEVVKVKLNGHTGASGGATDPLTKEPSSATTLWMPSWLTQETVSPTWIVRTLGVNRAVSMSLPVAVTTQVVARAAGGARRQSAAPTIAATARLRLRLDSRIRFPSGSPQIIKPRHRRG